MKIVIKSILLVTIILMSNESACPNGAETCKYGDSCSLKFYVDNAVDLFCNYENRIICNEESENSSKCGCYVDFEANFYSHYKEKENTCCLNHDSKCLKKTEFLFSCCKKEECVLDDPNEYEGKCQCITGYTYNTQTETCQKKVNFGEICDDDYDICASGLVCDENKTCVCETGKTYSDNGCITDTSSIKKDAKSYAKIINFKSLILIAYLCIFIF